MELLVVDNGSSDHTAQVVTESELPNVTLRHVVETTLGLSHARNRGLKEASGQIILFTDDDVRISADWIKRICGPISDDRADAVQGGVKPADALRRVWVNEFLRVWTAEVESADGPASTLVGANMAFHRRVLEYVPVFDSELGSGALGFFEDTLFGWQLSKAGFRLQGTPSATIEHHFSKDRLTLESFLVMAQRMARSRAYVMHHWEHIAPPDSCLESAYASTALIIRGIAQGIALLCGGNPHRKFIFDVYRRELLRARAQLAGTPRRYRRHGLSVLAAEQQEPSGSLVCQ